MKFIGFTERAAGIAAAAALLLAACSSTAGPPLQNPSTATSQTTTTTAQTTTATTTGPIILEVDTVSTHGCVQTNVFNRGADGIVWRIAVLRNGKEDKNATVTVNLKSGKTYKAGWSKNDGFYTAFWPLPFNAPTGVVSYTVTATDGSASATYTPPFLVTGSVLMIAPYTYAVDVSVGKNSITAGSSVPITANVTYTTTSKGKNVANPVKTGKVVAAIGLQGNVNAKGVLNALKTVPLQFSGTAWTGSIPTTGLQPGLYVVQVQAQDAVTPPNQGSGTSPAFNIR